MAQLPEVAYLRESSHGLVHVLKPGDPILQGLEHFFLDARTTGRIPGVVEGLQDLYHRS